MLLACDQALSLGASATDGKLGSQATHLLAWILVKVTSHCVKSSSSHAHRDSFSTYCQDEMNDKEFELQGTTRLMVIVILSNRMRMSLSEADEEWLDNPGGRWTNTADDLNVFKDFKNLYFVQIPPFFFLRSALGDV